MWNPLRCPVHDQDFHSTDNFLEHILSHVIHLEETMTSFADLPAVLATITTDLGTAVSSINTSSSELSAIVAGTVDVTGVQAQVAAIQQAAAGLAALVPAAPVAPVEPDQPAQ